MIPAVLSCLYVLYLYRILNSPAEESGASGSTGGSDDGLLHRLDKLQNQVDRMARAAEEENR
ncbi:hypothetical protein [Rhodopirellula sallentina]|uniref:Uncharacterized protein n=1 Tax=Rhodopirellula sallentina SM41 TaxID=1263870 RepID=M5TXA4_9BACT|nr:hypothetical protein [Rhodopirellula sallentina]EMI53857.1 hypothetical protein RSSM_04708 [Rhodopirellula sallentina SM41]